MRLPSALFIGLFWCMTSASALEVTDLKPLTDEPSRSELAQRSARELEPGTKGSGPKFKLPESANSNYTYGIDISHHNFSNGRKLDWASLPEKKITFVYMKATQGAAFIDPTFEKNWQAARAVAENGKPFHYGAYHFLSADVDADSQAKTFLAVIKKFTDFKKEKELPPVLDLEWDGLSSDRWKKYKPAEIVKKVNRWISVVSGELGVTPLVYTNAQWWKSVGLGETRFEGNPKLWIADYTNRANSKFSPIVPPKQRWFIWQFTDSAKISEQEFDGNVYLKDPTSFALDIGLDH